MIGTNGRMPLWTLVAVAAGAVGATLVLVFISFRLFVQPPPTQAPQAQPTVAVAGVTVVGTPPPPVATPVPGASPIAASSSTGAACSKPFSDAQALGQAGRWPEAASALEGVRSTCDVVGPLYDAYVNQARTLADQERSADAISMFDKALQVKTGTEATNERAMAVAYQDGRAALNRGDMDTAIDKLASVQSAKADYAAAITRST